MSQKPVINRILLDPNGPPIVITGGISFSEKFNITLDGIKPLGELSAEIKQDVLDSANPHECLLDDESQPEVTLGGEGNYTLFMKRDGNQMKFQLFTEEDDPISELASPVYEAELPASKMVETTTQMAEKTKSAFKEIMNKHGSNENHRNVRKFQNKITEDLYKVKFKHLMEALSGAVTFNKDFLMVVANIIEQLTIHENAHLLSKAGNKEVRVTFGGSGSEQKYTH